MTKSALVLALLSSVCWVDAAVAQTALSTAPPASGAAEPPPSVGEVVVTALKQNTTALNTPATVTVLSREALGNRNVTSVNQLNAVVPGLVMSVGVGGLPGVSFRGLGSNSAVFSLEPSVAQYQDGVYLGHVRDYVSPLYDIDHVEFIKGTQSTLLGKNASLGAISVVNHRPGRQFGWDIDASHSFGIDGNKVEGAINVPLSDRVQVRAAVLAAEDNGYVENVFKNRSEARQRDVSGRLMIAFEPTDAIDGLFSYQHDYRRLTGQDLQVVYDPAGVVAARATAEGAPFPVARPDFSGSGSDALGGASLGPDTGDSQDTDRLNLILNAQLGAFKLTSQTAYVRWNSQRVTDLDFTAANLFNLVDQEKSRSVSEELRLSSEAFGRLHYLAGVYYYDNSWDYTRVFGSPPSNTVGFPFTGAATSVTSLPTRTFSAFASGTFDLSDAFKLDAGVRYTHERKSGVFQRVSSGVFGGVFPTTLFTVYTPQISDPVDYNIGLRYQPSSALLLYVSYSKATKSGGYQDAPTTAAGAPFSPETAYSAELGAKMRLDRGYVTLAVFDTRITNFQTSYTAPVGVPPVSQTVVGNAQVRSTGVEVSAAYQVFSALRLSGDVVYADSHFSQNFATIALSGDQLTRAPKWSGRVEGEYHTEIRDGLTGFTSLSVDFASQTLYQFIHAQPSAPKGDAHALLGARVGIRGRGDAWELAVIGTNLNNERFVDFATSITGGGGAYYGSYNRPRVVALQLTFKQ